MCDPPPPQTHQYFQGDMERPLLRMAGSCLAACSHVRFSISCGCAGASAIISCPVSSSFFWNLSRRCWSSASSMHRGPPKHRLRSPMRSSEPREICVGGAAGRTETRQDRNRNQVPQHHRHQSHQHQHHPSRPMASLPSAGWSTT